MPLQTFINKFQHTFNTEIYQTKYIAKIHVTKFNSFLLHNLYVAEAEGYWTKAERAGTATWSPGSSKSKLQINWLINW
jgi:hypothetical protein